MTEFEQHTLDREKNGPLELHFESSGRCNARCLTCPRDTIERPLGEMPREIFVKGIDEVAVAGWQLDYLFLHLNGEPLLLPVGELVWRLDYARRKLPSCKELVMFTNASLMTKEITDKLLKSELNVIVFSVDGGNKESYERVRRGLSWDTTIANIEYFMEARAKTGLKIRTQTAFIPQRANADSLKEYYEVFKKLGIDSITGSGVNNIGGLIAADSMLLPQQYMEGSLTSPCWKLWLDMSIMWDGRVCVCCQDVAGLCIIGDLKTQNIKDIWQGEIMQEIRRKHRARKQSEVPFCSKCDYMRGFDQLPDWWPR